MNRMKKHSLLLAICLLVWGPNAGAQDMSPTEFVRAQADSLLTIINQPAAAGSPELAERQEALKAAVRSFIDFEELCRRALGDHWETRTAEEQQSFVALMTQLVETNYTVKLGNRTVDSPYDVAYTDEDIIRHFARVTGTVTSDGVSTAVEIMMIQRETGWIVYDIVTDDVSVQETYAESFDEIIRDEGWEALQQRLRDRLEELELELEEQRQALE